MEPAISQEHFECLVGTEVPIKVTETGCCGAIIGEECGPKLKTCPNRGLTEGQKLDLNLNKFVQRMINHLKVKGKYGMEEFSRSDMIAHWDACPKNNIKPVIANQILHSCCLYKRDKSNSWFCDGLKIIKGGGAKSGTKKEVTEKSYSWYCERGDTDFCEYCIQKYATVNSYDEMRQFSKDTNMHLSHPHPLTLGYGANLPEQAMNNCYGKYKNNGCDGGGDKNLRYLVGFNGKLLLGEKCFVADSDDFLVTVPADAHKHVLHLQSIPPTFTWGCDLKLPNCLKKDHMVNKASRISFRCDIGDFDMCLECIKEKKG